MVERNRELQETALSCRRNTMRIGNLQSPDGPAHLSLCPLGVGFLSPDGICSSTVMLFLSTLRGTKLQTHARIVWFLGGTSYAFSSSFMELV